MVVDGWWCARVYEGVEDLLEDLRHMKKMSRRDKAAWSHVRCLLANRPASPRCDHRLVDHSSHALVMDRSTFAHA